MYKTIRKIAIMSLILTIACFIGAIMVEERYKTKIVSAIKSNKNHEAIEACYEWQKSGDISNKPLFLLTKAIVHLRNGNSEAAMHNLVKLLEQ